MDLFLLLCLGLVFSCTTGQWTYDRDTLSHILTELKILKEAQHECTNKYSELHEYKSRILSLENTVKDLQDTVNDLHRENTELDLKIHRLADNTGQMETSNVNKYETETEGPVEEFSSVDNRDAILNATNPLQESVKKVKMAKSDDRRIRNVIERSFTSRPTPTKPGIRQTETIAFTAYLGHDEEVHQGNILKFNQVLHNGGKAYNSYTGIFTVPVTGTYILSFQVEDWMTREMPFYLKVNGKNMVDAIISSSGSTQSGNTAVLGLTSGDKIWVEASEGHVYGGSGFRGTTFCGAYLY